MSTESIVSSDSKSAKQVIYGLSVFVSLAVAAVIYLVPQVPVGREPSVLATANAALNATAGCLLVAGLVFIKRRQIEAHRRAMVAAFVTSSVFLVTYLLHHAQVGSVPFRGEGLVRTVYFGLLIPHIILAAVIVPLALFTIYRGWTGRIELHRRVARITLPLWLYVSVSGVAIYGMLYYI
jgi:putative membrane protein